jgi:hypothetical protein
MARERRGLSLIALPLKSLLDLGRLACALERVPYPVLHLEFEGREVLGVLLSQLDRHIPFCHFIAEAGWVGQGQFLAYKLREGEEKVAFTDYMLDPTHQYAPLIRLGEPAGWITRALKQGPPRMPDYTPLRLKDLTSLVKLASYRLVVEESIPPLLTFEAHGGWVLGFFSVQENSYVAPIFVYAKLESEPTAPFLRYDLKGGPSVSMAADTFEHGFLYLKLIRLAKAPAFLEGL